MGVLKGVYDVGICGSDVFLEGKLAGIFEPLGFRAIMGAGCDLVLAGPEGLNLRKRLRIATSFPLQTIVGCARLGYDLDLDRLDEWGGKIEGMVATGAYDAISDLRSSGDTLRDNNLIVYDCLDTIQLGVVFRKMAYDTRDYVFDPWRIYSASQTLKKRYAQLKNGAEFDPDTKSTLSLMADDNKLRKALGEESAELIAAQALNKNVVGEAADLRWTSDVAIVKSGSTPIRAINEDSRRNKPDLEM